MAAVKRKFHIWLDEKNKLVEDAELIDDLFIKLLVLRNARDKDLRDQAEAYEQYAKWYDTQADDYAELAGAATTLEVCSQALSIYLGGGTDLLGGGLAAYSSLELAGKLYQLFGDEQTIVAKTTGARLQQQRWATQRTLINVVGDAKSLKSVADTGKKLVDPLQKGLRPVKTALLNRDWNSAREKLKQGLTKSGSPIKNLEASDVWGLFTGVVDNKKVAEGSIDFCMKNRTAFFINRQLASLYRRAADDLITDADELLLILELEPTAARLRQDLLKLYAKKYGAHRDGTLSGWLLRSIEWTSGKSVTEKAQTAIDMNQDLIRLLEDRTNRTWLGLEVQTRLTYNALRSADGKAPEGWSPPPAPKLSVQPRPRDTVHLVQDLPPKSQTTEQKNEEASSESSSSPVTTAKSKLGQSISLESFASRGKHVRHAFDFGQVSEIKTSLDRKDATFRLRPGLAKTDFPCVSFESVNYPGSYLRHSFSRIRIDRREHSELFKQDATFRLVPGLADPSWISLQSFNFPDKYIRQSKGHLIIEEGNNEQFRKDATFRIVTARTSQDAN
jgi:hypothetical protein